MKRIETKLPGVFILEPVVHADARGYFYESFNQKTFETLIERKVIFTQDNQSYSQKGVLRGLHYQLPPMAQCKLIRCLSGKIYDVVVDIRRYSPTFGQWLSFILSADNKRQLWIPEGFAHGFLVLSDTAEIFYKVTQYWSSEHERCIHWADKELKIPWTMHAHVLLISDKDKKGMPLEEVPLFED